LIFLAGFLSYFLNFSSKFSNFLYIYLKI
jgi:hypothetical protein